MELEEALKSRFEAVKALVVYRLGGQNAYYASMHDIVDGALAEGRPMTQNALVELCALVMPEIKQTVKFIPPNVLAYTPGHDHGLMMWWVPAGVRHLHFHRETGIPSGPAPVPATLFMVRGGSLHVWAMDVKERPEPGTPLYHAPFFNLFGWGMCTGDLKAPKDVKVSDIPRWESLFFDSAFTTDAEPELRGIKPGTLWSRLVKGKGKKFPVRYLAPTGKKIKNLLEGI
jgi:PRTRC genetic system protein B